MSRLAWEIALHWTAVGLYVVATMLLAWIVVFRHAGRARLGLFAAALGLLPHGAALLVRWIASGHGPYIMKYEVLSSNAWVVVAMLVVVLWRRPQWAAVGLVALPVALLMVAGGLFTNPEIRELPPTLRSIWLAFHVGFNKLAAGAFVLSVGSAVVYLLKRRGSRSGWLSRLPEVDALEAYTARFIGFGFIFWTITIVAGAIWANQSWGRYWGWDPIEIWSLIVWLCYGTYLHLRVLFRMRGAASAWTALVCFVILVFTMFLLPLSVPSVHSAYFQ